MRQFKLFLLTVLSVVLASCTIQPPLNLADKPVPAEIKIPIVITDLNVIWNVEGDWRAEWYYGWDELDELLWGKIEYPEPTNYEVRSFFNGQNPNGSFLSHDEFTIYEKKFKRKYEYGYHDMLIWSNIDSPDGTQTVIVDESDLSNIVATTTKTRINYSTERLRARVVDTHNQPEIFYASQVTDFYISNDPEDYDYYDPEENVYVKRIKIELVPVVYIYLVQVIIHNNNGRIIGVADKSAISGLADAVSLHTGETSQVDANITFDMRLKEGIDVKGESCDILGGKLTTYGLCGLKPWRQHSGPDKIVTREDLDNYLSMCLILRNGKEMVVNSDVTEVIREHPHGGIITIHVNLDDFDIPDQPADSGFSPTVDDYTYKEYEFSI